jgi:hypothetical protein
MTTPDSGLSAALLQLTQFGERIALLDDREARNFRHVENTLAAMSTAITSLRTAAEGQARVLESLDGLGESVALLAAQVADLLPAAEDEPPPGYKAAPSIHWWTVKDEDRRAAVAHLAAWVEQVYRPHYGHLAAMLGACWAEHPLCLVGLDWLSELHSILYFQPKRSAALLSAQAEFGMRIMPAVSEQFRAETSRCTHRATPATANGNRWAGAR